MPEYLSKEEIRKWRSSLERITLEEYAARLGKVIQEEKHDDSLVDSVILKSLNYMSDERYTPSTEKIGTLSLKSFQKEKEIKAEKENLPELKSEQKASEKIKQEKAGTVEKSEETAKSKKQATKAKIEKAQPAEKSKETVKSSKKTASQNIDISFKKALTDREQTVFDHFLENKNTVVYAADLATILDLPRDYVYKYIKNLRSKLNEDILQNASNGGYMLKV